MSSFRFNFGNEDYQQKEEESNDIQWLASEEVIPTGQLTEIDSIARHARIFACGEVEIGHVIVNEAVTNIIKSNSNSSAIELAEKGHSDLVAGEYEGGLKIWECTYDLIEFMSSNPEKLKLKDAKVLDLGCGAGIVGIYAYMNRAHVTFQDYNKEVLENVTIPNVLLNTEDDRETEIKKCKFYSGDWASFNELLSESDVYDIIFTAETIYNETNYDKIIDLFSKRLQSYGVVYLAAKTHYFGVGGGIRQFEQSLQKSGKFVSEVCFKSSFGIQREILKIIKKN